MSDRKSKNLNTECELWDRSGIASTHAQVVEWPDSEKEGWKIPCNSQPGRKWMLVEADGTPVRDKLGRLVFK